MTSLASELELNEEQTVQTLTTSTLKTDVRFLFKSIAYNGSYWLAGGYDTIRTKTLLTYPAVFDLLNSYYDYSAFIKVADACISSLEYRKVSENTNSFNEDISYLKGRVSSAKILQKAALSQASSTYKTLRETSKVVINGVSYPRGLVTYQINTFHTLMKSTDGYSWKIIEMNPFQPEVRAASGYSGELSKAGIINGLAWNPTLKLWIAVGNRGNDKWNRTQYGGQHTKNSLTQLTNSDINGMQSDSFTYTTSSGQFKQISGVYTDKVSIATSSDGEIWNQYSFHFNTIANDVACSSDLTVVVGKEFKTQSGGSPSVATSTDCVSWNYYTLTGTGAWLDEGRGVAYNGSMWVVVGRGTTGYLTGTTIFTSLNGTTWTARNIPPLPDGYSFNSVDFETNSKTRDYFRLNSVAWNGSSWIAVGKFKTVYSSEDGISWTFVGFVDFNKVEYTPNVDARESEFNDVTWDGNFWVITGAPGTYRSKDSVIWEKINESNGKCVTSNIVLPILGGTIQTTNSIITGYGSPSSIVRSSDNLKWYPQLFDSVSSNRRGNKQKTFYDVVWTGNYWVVVGEPNEGNYYGNIARSSTGTEWNFPSNQLKTTCAIGWNGADLIIVGEDPSGASPRVARSTDQGATWTSGDLPLGSGRCIAWNGTLWVAGGYPGIATSTNGTTWTAVNNCPLETVYSIAWNGYTWVATGNGKSHSIAVSINGTYWYTANPKTNPFDKGYAVAWNRKCWIAVGVGSNHTIATSVDGYTWTGLGTTVFGTSGTSIAWTGTNWIASGIGYYPFATSTDGVNWTKYDIPIQKALKFCTKSITLPYTGVDNQSVLTAVNSATSIITASTNNTIAEEEAAIKLAQDAVASAAAAAAEAQLRLTSKNAAINYRIKFLFWKKRISDQIEYLTDKTYIDLKTEYPVEYINAISIYNKLIIYVSDGQLFYEKVISPASPVSIVTANLQCLETFNNSLSNNLLQFYNNARVLFKYILDAKYDKYVTNSNTLTVINNYGFSNSDKTKILNAYGSSKTTLDSNRSSANSTFNTEISSISYSTNLLPSALQDKELTDLVLITPGGNTYATIYSQISTNVPDLYSLYTGINFGLVLYLGIFSGNYVYKQQADTYVSNTFTTAAKWAAVTGGSVPTTEINNQFNTLYNKYFYISDFPYYYQAWSGAGGNVDATSRAIKYFKIIAEDYSHPSQYDTELQTLYNTLKNKLDSIETTRITALNYARNSRNTTVKTKLTTFLNTTKTNYTLSLGIDNHIQTLCSLTYYSDSSYERANKFAKLVKVASKVYPQLYPFIRAVKWADAEAEDDGCIAPSTGWGSALSELPVNERGKQGLSGWTKFNETYYARQRLTDHIRSHNVNGFVSYNIDNELIGDGILWKDFLNFTETFTYDLLKGSIDDLTATVNTINGNSLFSESTMDGIVNQDLLDIQSQIIPTATTYLSNLLTSTTEILPSSEDASAFGSVTVNGSATLSSMVSSINSLYDSLTTAATVSLTGKTNSEIQTIVENAVTYKNSINTIQQSTAYTNILSGISVYKINLQRASDYIDHMEEQIARWTRMKSNAILNIPYSVSELNNGSGTPFIAGVLPTDSNYWTQRTYTVYYNLTNQQYEECTFDNNSSKVVTSLSPINSADYAAYSSTSYYKLGDIVKYNNKLYECTKDSTSEYLDSVLTNLATSSSVSGASSQSIPGLFIKGVVPTTPFKWKRRLYPKVIYNGSTIEADPSVLKSLVLSDYEPYTPTYGYSENDMVRSGQYIYYCISDIKQSHKIKGILPTNDNYWEVATYPTVLYNSIEIQASPTNLPALDLANFQEYSDSVTYYKGQYVKQNSNIYELVEYTTPATGTKVIVSSYASSPADNQNSRWIQRTYPVVYVNGVKTEATPGTFSALNLSNITAFSDQSYYVHNDYVKYNNTIYRCRLKNRNTLVGVPVSNTEYWMKVGFPVVTYNNKRVEAIPGAIPALVSGDYTAYNEKTKYYSGDFVSYNGFVYECVNSVPYGTGIVNTAPIMTQYWKERKYPYVLVNNSVVEANPDSGNFVQLNQLDFHKFEKGFLYNVGDMVSYNGNVYQCTNVTPPLVGTTSISNIPPTNLNRWSKLNYTLETKYSISHWYPTIYYDVSKLVSYNGKVYICETKTLNNIPSDLGIYWREFIDYDSINVPVLYSSVTSYGTGAVISYRETGTNLPNNETHILNFYVCYSTEDRPTRYKYDILYTLDTVDEDGNYKYGIETGNWKSYVPRYGLPEDDPFSVPMFAAKLRRRVAMDIELPYEIIKYNTYQFNTRFKEYFRKLLTQAGHFDIPGFYSYEKYNIVPSNALSTYSALETRGQTVCDSFTTLESDESTDIYNLVSKAYQNISNYLTTTYNSASFYAEKIRTIKTQYFNNPGVQQKIYENPYKFMNPVAFAETPPRRMFRDLGVGDIKEMESEVYSGNQLNYTLENIREYYEKQGIIELCEEELGKLLLQAKCVTGFGILFKMINSNTKMGARIPCLIEDWDDLYSDENMSYPASYGPYVNINLPITEYDIYGRWLPESRNKNGTAENPAEGTIVYKINEIMKVTIKPPDYCAGPNPLLEALTYESKNPAIIGLGAVARGVVGLASAAFKNFADPWQLFGAIEFIGQVVTNDYQKKILTFIPEGNWPTFNDRAKDIQAFKQLVNIERDNIKQSKEQYDKTQLAQFLETVGKLLRLNQKNLDGINIIIREIDDINTSKVIVPETPTAKPPVTITEPIVIPDPPNPPPDYTPPKAPEPPELQTRICQANLKQERDSLIAMQKQLQERINNLDGIFKSPTEVYVPIPKAVYNEVDAVTSNSKTPRFEVKGLTRAALNSIGSTAPPTRNTVWEGLPKENTNVTKTKKLANADDIAAAVAQREIADAEYRAAKAEADLNRAQRQAIQAQLDENLSRQSAINAEINETDMKNAVIDAENDELTKQFRKEYTDWEENVRSLEDQQALAEERYQQALKEHEANVKKSPEVSAQSATKLEESKTNLNSATQQLSDAQIESEARRLRYQTRLLSQPPIVAFISRMFPPRLIAEYNVIVNSVNSLTDSVARRLRNIATRAVAPAAAASRSFMAFLDNRPHLRPFASGFRAINARGAYIRGALGPLMEVAGIGVQAWQDGAFNAAETLD